MDELVYKGGTRQAIIMNTNIRFQWRYKLVSDLYVVYTDNYFAYEATD